MFIITKTLDSKNCNITQVLTFSLFKQNIDTEIQCYQ